MNVLLLVCDEMAPWGIGAEGVSRWAVRALTPHLDALAARGTRFSAAYSPSPICVPGRASIATGRWVHETGCWSSAEAYAGSPPSWGHALQGAGLAPVSIGKLHYRSGLDDTGFVEEIEPIHILKGRGWVQGLLRQPLCEYDGTADLAAEIGPGDSDYLAFDRRVTAAAETWLAAPERAERPWCAMISWLSPHYPLIAPEAFYALYDAGALAGEAEAGPDHPVLRDIAGFFNHDRFFTPETRGIARASYFALCSFIDAQVGRVLAALEAAGQAEETLILFTSDHGEMLGEKGFWTKSTMYEASARVPLLAAGPGVAAGRVWPAPVSLIDLAPTICAAMGAEMAGLPGCDLRAPQANRAVISEYHDGGSPVGLTMMRWDEDGVPWKYVHYAEGHPPQLFCLGDDPAEERDLAPVAPERVAAARARLSEIVDPEDANARAHADQAVLIERLGGREVLLAEGTFGYTPADSR